MSNSSVVSNDFDKYTIAAMRLYGLRPKSIKIPVDDTNWAVADIQNFGDLSEVKVTWHARFLDMGLDAPVITDLVSWGSGESWARKFVEDNKRTLMRQFEDAHENGLEVHVQ